MGTLERGGLRRGKPEASAARDGEPGLQGQAMQFRGRGGAGGPFRAHCRQNQWEERKSHRSNEWRGSCVTESCSLGKLPSRVTETLWLVNKYRSEEGGRFFFFFL